jgi:hypothetical protein
VVNKTIVNTFVLHLSHLPGLITQFEYLYKPGRHGWDTDKGMLQLMQTKLCSIRFMPHYFIVTKVAVYALMPHSRVGVAETDGVVIFQPTKPQAYVIQFTPHYSNLGRVAELSCLNQSSHHLIRTRCGPRLCPAHKAEDNKIGERVVAKRGLETGM